jgi:UDP-N-acetylglucosamine 4,6-dehydratase/5-epimerase
VSIEGSTFLITGGTGSFGQHVARRLLQFDVKEVRVFSRDEKKQGDLRSQLKDPRLNLYLGDVKDRPSITDAMRGVDYVFHAAALKQVPSCDFFPMEAVKTNIQGASNVMRSAKAHGVKKVIVLSTDKAVYPINAMGMSKALMEKVMIAESRNSENTVFAGTRYGNVIASRGSVIPLFIKQVRDGVPLTLTDPAMTRFLMSLDEAVDLVLYAFTHASQGDIYVQKAPAATVQTIASAVSKIFDVPHQQEVIGTRLGEKRHETLINREEFSKSIEWDKYYEIPSESDDIDFDKYVSEGESFLDSQEYSSYNTKRLTVEETIDILMGNSDIQEILYSNQLRKIHSGAKVF